MPLKDHLNKLEYFCAVVDAKSILRASYSAGVTQPQLSRIIKQLEDDLGKQLLIRTPTGIELTKDGLELYNTSNLIIQETLSAEKKIKFGSSDIKGSIRIGTYDSIGRYFFPSFLKYIKASLPKLQINLETSRSSIIFNKVKNKELDIGICVYQDNLNFNNMITDDIYSDSFGYYHHPSIATQFKDQIIIFPEAIGHQQDNVEPFMKKYKFKTKIVSDNLETVKSLSEESVGVGLLPHRVAREAVLQGKLVEFKGLKLKKDLFPHKIIICKNEDNTSQSLTSLTTELKRFLSSWSKS